MSASRTSARLLLELGSALRADLVIHVDPLALGVDSGDAATARDERVFLAQLRATLLNRLAFACFPPFPRGALGLAPPEGGILGIEVLGARARLAGDRRARLDRALLAPRPRGIRVMHLAGLVDAFVHLRAG